jgi:endonuclease YncB( thermonuclease family)
MRTPRGYASVIMTILVLGISSYFGYKGQKSILTPSTTLSQQRQPHGGEGAKVPPEVAFNDTQVVVPSTVADTLSEEPNDTTPLPERKGKPDEVFVKRVIDGDTIELNSGEKVRLIGIDTPETVDPRKPVQCFGLAAKEFTKSLLENQWVRLELDVQPKDKYRRTLAYVWRDDVMVNDTLVKEGFARILTIPPDVKYVETFKQSEASARAQQKGLWGECTTK